MHLADTGRFFCFFVDILAIFCTTMQISLRIRYLAPELCPMHLKNVVSARPEQTCIFHRLTRFLCCSVACIYNMPNKIPKRRFFVKNFKNIFLHLPVLFFACKKKETIWPPSEQLSAFLSCGCLPFQPGNSHRCICCHLTAHTIFRTPFFRKFSL